MSNPPRIFISYRRADSVSITGRIYDRLTEAFGEANVFKDVDDIPPGGDFPQVLRDAVSSYHVMLVIIGPRWLDIPDEQGNRRLDHPQDFVRIEVEIGLSRQDMLVIPVLVSGASMPKPEELPASIEALAYRNKVDIREDPDFHRDVSRLIEKIGFPPRSRVASLSKVEIVKRLIPNDADQIQLNEILLEATESAYSAFTSDDFYQRRNELFNSEDVKYEDIWALYLIELVKVINMFVALCLHGNGKQSQRIEYALSRWIEIPRNSDEQTIVWRYFPYFLLSYACGIAAVRAQDWNYLQMILIKPRIKSLKSEQRVSVLWEANEHILTFRQGDFGYPGNSGYIYELLRPIFGLSIPSDEDFHNTFDLFEVLMASTYLYLTKGRDWMPTHLAYDTKRSWEYIKDFWSQGGDELGEWTLLRAGFFDRSPLKLYETLQHYGILAAEFRNKRLFGKPPDYALAYGKGRDMTRARPL